MSGNYTDDDIDNNDGQQQLPQLIDYFSIRTAKSITGDERNITYSVAHFGFLIFNVVNVLVLLLWQGYVTKRLWSNPVAKWSLASHIFQLLSCSTSLYRYNHDDEFGSAAILGVSTGLIALNCMNFAFLHLLFFNDTTKIRIGMFFWTILAIVVYELSEKNWEKLNFLFFRAFLGVSILTMPPIMWRARKALTNGAFTVEEGFMSRDAMIRVWDVLIFLDCVWFANVPLGNAIFTYPATGMVYMVCMFNSICVGRMSFMTETSSTSGERLSLVR